MWGFVQHPSGEAVVCEKLPETYTVTFTGFTLCSSYVVYLQYLTGRRSGLKIRWSQGRVGSTPSSGTILSSMFVWVFEIYFFWCAQVLRFSGERRCNGRDFVHRYLSDE
jgi:hypothetical protein